MSRSWANLLVWPAVLALFALPAGTQQRPINPRIPPPPPAQPAPTPAEKPSQPVPPAAPPPASTPLPMEPKKAEPVTPRVIPATVVLPAGMRVSVVLDTPMSTRISQKGQAVVFRTERALPLEDSLELPPNTAFIGNVVKVKRPGSFGKQGEIRVEVNELKLSTGQATAIDARINSADPSYSGRGGSDRSRAANLINLALWTAQGTALGANIHGGSGAAVGAGAGALVGLIILASHHGADVYLEPGMPFSIILEQPATLSGPAVAAAEDNYRNAQQSGSSVASGSGPPPTAPQP